jgi:hypothetical protein
MEAWPTAQSHYVPSAIPLNSPSDAYAPSPTTGVPAYLVGAPPSAVPLTGYTLAAHDLPPNTASTGKVPDETVVAIAAPEIGQTWNNRLWPAFCAAAGVVISVSLVLATAAPTGVPSAVYSWTTTNATTNATLGIGIAATVNMDPASKNLTARPLWIDWAGGTSPECVSLAS